MRSPLPRTRADRCPGVLRPWPAEDGGLIRIRVPGGQVSTPALRALIDVAEEYGDGRVRVTARANLQLRGFAVADAELPEEIVAAIEATGLLPSRRHDLVRNILVSPQTGLAGGRADLRPTCAALDRTLLAESRYGDLPGRFLFTLDDGRGDLADQHRDLGLVALSAETVRLRVGGCWGAVVALAEAPAALAELTGAFLDARGAGPDAPWHVSELTVPLVAAATESPRAEPRGEPLPFGWVPGGRHVAVGSDGLDRAAIDAWTTAQVVITPWRGVLVPEEDER